MINLSDIVGGSGTADPLGADKANIIRTVMGMLTGNTSLSNGFADTFFYETILPVMVAADTLGVTISGTSFVSTNYAWRAATGTNSTANSWVASAAPTAAATQWIKISSSTVQKIARYNFWTRNDPTYVYSPKSWKIFVSTSETASTYTTEVAWDSATEWTLVHSISNNTINTPAVKLGDYELSQVYDWKHIAIVITSANGGAARVAIGEMNVYPAGINLNATYGVEYRNGLVRPLGANSIPLMTADVSAQGICSASSVFSTDFPAWKAADKSVSGYNGWGSAAVPTPAAPQWWQFEYPEAVTIIAMGMQNREQYPNSPNTFAVYGTNADAPGTDYTNAEWTNVLATTVNTNNTSGALLGSWNFGTTGSFKKYRIVITARNSTNSNVSIGEVMLYPAATSGYSEALIESTEKVVTVAPSYAMGIVWLDAKGATVTDAVETNNALRLQISRDNGATWDWLPLVDYGVFSGSVKTYSCDQKLLQATSGTAIKLRFRSYDLGLGFPDFELHGWGGIYNQAA